MRPTVLDAPIRLADTLRGGQSFRWRPRDDGGFEGVVDGRHVTLRSTDEGVAVAGADAAWARRYFRLDAPYEAQLTRLAEDSFLADAVQTHRGLRVLRQDPWETLAAFITSANNNVVRIEGILDRLCQAAGAPVADGWHAFPAPDAVAALGEARLRELGLGYRAPYLVETARRVAAGAVHLAALREAPYEEAKEALLELPGVGPKVADCVLLFGLDQPEAFPVDVWVARVVRAAYPDAPERPAHVGAWARERWGRDAGLAQQFLFHAARLQGVGAQPGRRAPGTAELTGDAPSKAKRA